jgi:hypothetical protein
MVLSWLKRDRTNGALQVFVLGHLDGHHGQGGSSDRYAHHGWQLPGIAASKDEDSDGYVVLAGIAAGNYQYYAMSAEEFIQFADAVQTIKSQLSSMNRR